MHDTSADTSAVTSDDLAEFVAAAYREPLPSPYTVTPLNKRVLAFFESFPSEGFSEIVWVGDLINNNVTVPEWDPYHTDLLKRYLTQKYQTQPDYAERVAQRIAELEQNSPILPDEQTAYEDAYAEHHATFDTPQFAVFRVRAPLPDQSNAVCAVYVVIENYIVGQGGDTEAVAGPFRTLEDVIAALRGEPGSPFPAVIGNDVYFDPMDDDEETARLEQLYRIADEQP